MLNTTYDLSVGPCDGKEFLEREDDDRYQQKAQGWAAINPFSVHMSCLTHKPSCVRDKTNDEELPVCIREMFDEFYRLLSQFDMNELQSGVTEDLNAHGEGMERKQQATKTSAA